MPKRKGLDVSNLSSKTQRARARDLRNLPNDSDSSLSGSDEDLPQPRIIHGPDLGNIHGGAGPFVVPQQNPALVCHEAADSALGDFVGGAGPVVPPQQNPHLICEEAAEQGRHAHEMEGVYADRAAGDDGDQENPVNEEVAPQRHADGIRVLEDLRADQERAAVCQDQQANERGEADNDGEGSQGGSGDEDGESFGEEDGNDSDEEHEEDEILHAQEDFEDNDLNQDPPLIIDDDPPLYAGSRISLSESLLMILTFYMKHNISGACLEDLLHLLELHCPAVNHCKTTSYFFKKHFKDLKLPVTFQYFCAQCYNNLATKDAICETCQENMGVRYFIQTSIIDQLTSFYKRPGFREKLQHRFNRVKKHPNNIEDLYDGAIYKELSEAGYLSDRNSLSFCWYWDGFSKFKKSKLSLWPLMLTINELPYHERAEKENVILAGLWFGADKPRPNTFLRFMYDEIHQLATGIDVLVPGLEQPLNITGKIICGTADLEARAQIMNMKKFNGRFGCLVCTQSGEKFGEVGNIWVYPFQEVLELRTLEQHRANARVAVRMREPQLGVKGPTFLMLLVLNFLRSTAIDEMHCLCGIVKKLLELWFGESYKNEDWSLNDMLQLVNERLLSIKPPTFVQRRPRAIDLHGAYWKMSERRNWLFYYSAPVLQGVLGHAYFNNYLLLLKALYILSSNSISEDMIEESSILLSHFVQGYQNLYGLRHMSANIHQLRHLPNKVRDLGPLWVTSCFPYESLLGEMGNLIHGTRSAELQLVNLLSLFTNLPIAVERAQGNPLVYDYCSKLTDYVHRLKLTPIEGNISFVGNFKTRRILPAIVQDALDTSFIIGRNVKLFYRLKRGHTLLYSEMYPIATKTDSCTVEYSTNEGNLSLGLIYTFAAVTDCNCEDMCNHNPLHLCVIRKLNCNVAFERREPPFCVLDNIKRCVVSNDNEAIPVANLRNICFNVSVNNQIFVIPVLNRAMME